MWRRTRCSVCVRQTEKVAHSSIGTGAVKNARVEWNIGLSPRVHAPMLSGQQVPAGRPRSGLHPPHAGAASGAGRRAVVVELGAIADTIRQGKRRR